ncbi:hypothetical protein MA16_Dca002666 [Dendrobium catenatum]|uniref:Retrotransposon gag domain-containing protein n=1 Tax=Dendrobium catenatum TaxID=906689 RepID=A0A2I0X8B8_9ASPA|nr:hypothetical protein MA16_Dca002666 [Dendrobium catenatum]
MIQNSQFGGTPIMHWNPRLASFLKICAIFKYDGVINDAIRLQLSSFSLKDKAKMWLNYLPPSFIITWNALAHKFIAKYFKNY